MGNPAGLPVAARLNREMVVGVRRVLIVVAVLAVLLVGADRAAVWAAQRGLAAAIQQSQDLAETPEVHIGGFPFLTQAISGNYQQVDVTVADLPTQSGLQVDQQMLLVQAGSGAIGDWLDGLGLGPYIEAGPHNRGAWTRELHVKRGRL